MHASMNAIVCAPSSNVGCSPGQPARWPGRTTSAEHHTPAADAGGPGRTGSADFNRLTTVVPTTVGAHRVGPLWGVAAIAQRARGRFETPVGRPTGTALRLGGLALGNSHGNTFSRGRRAPLRGCGLRPADNVTVPPSRRAPRRPKRPVHSSGWSSERAAHRGSGGGASPSSSSSSTVTG